VRDGQGRKMSKSIGNVVDPVEVIAQHGTDALRFTLATGRPLKFHSYFLLEEKSHKAYFCFFIFGQGSGACCMPPGPWLTLAPASHTLDYTKADKSPVFPIPFGVVAVPAAKCSTAA
jgi:hypothetical protein